MLLYSTFLCVYKMLLYSIFLCVYKTELTFLRPNSMMGFVPEEELSSREISLNLLVIF